MNLLKAMLIVESAPNYWVSVGSEDGGGSNWPNAVLEEAWKMLKDRNLESMAYRRIARMGEQVREMRRLEREF